MRRIAIITLSILHLMTITAQEQEYTQGKAEFDRGNYETALVFFDKSLQGYKQTGDTLNETYANLLNNTASALYRTGKAAEAIPFGKRALNLYERLYGSSYSSYAEQCVNLATYFYEIGEYGMSTSYENFAIWSYDRQNIDYFTKTGIERLTIMYEQAEADGIEVKMGFSPHITLREVFDTNISRKWEKGNDLLHLRACKEKVDKMLDDGDSTSLDFLHAIDDLALAYIGVNDADEATAWMEYGGPMKNDLCGEQSIEAAQSYYIYAMAAFAKGDMVTANERADITINILNNIKEQDNETYMDALMLSCSSYLHMGILGTADKQGPRLVQVADSLFGKDSRQYDAARFLYAQCLFRLEKEHSMTISLLRDCLEWRKKHLGDNHPDTVNALVALANFLSSGNATVDATSRFEEAESLYNTFYHMQNENVKANFLGMSIEEQRDYWNLFSRYYLELIPKCSLKKLKANRRTSMPSSICYNAALLGKGILLNSENLMREALQQTSNEKLKKLYNEIAQEKLELMNLLNSQESKETAKIDNVRRSISIKQTQLADGISSFSDYTNRLATDWKDVQKHLGDKEVAIEFVNMIEEHQKLFYFYENKRFLALPSGTQEENRYAAAIITSHSTEPILLSLFDLNDIGNLYFEGKLRQQYLSQLLWKPIFELLGNDIENIYFSASGVLHNLPIESLEDWDGNGWVSNHANLYRLSSTRVLCYSDMEKGKGGVVYGGLDYDATIKELSANASKYPHSHYVKDTKNNLTGNKIKREAIDVLPYLQGTKKEADIIHSLLRKWMSNVTLLEGNSGTEESFKALDGKKNRVIHIGTHGFFDTPVDSIIGTFAKEDISMISSGLFLAGANNALIGEKIPKGIDDGSLTSEEISSLDLRGLDMVSLSACQTALGEVTRDGVHGLQRGFKKAGANSILMSLWKVDDEATCLLMTEFYKNWIGEKKTKHEALELAKQTVRSHKDKGWDDPKYWAAFILLDGLD